MGNNLYSGTTFSVARQINLETERHNEIMHEQKEKDSTEQTENKLYI